MEALLTEIITVNYAGRRVNVLCEGLISEGLEDGLETRARV